MILDGRCRYIACLLADVAPPFKEYDARDPSEKGLSDYFYAVNVIRTHKTPGQLACARTLMKEMMRERGCSEAEMAFLDD